MSNTVNWSNKQVIEGYNAAMEFKAGNYVGALKYKAATLAQALLPTVVKIREESVALVGKYQRVLPAKVEGEEPRKVPAMQEGKALPLDVWCTNQPAYMAEDTDLMNVKQELHIPVRFTYEELAPLMGVRGEFWDALYELIDPPKAQPSEAAK